MFLGLVEVRRAFLERLWGSCFLFIDTATGTNIQEAQCANTTANTGTNCFAAFLGLHLTAGSSAYLEVNAHPVRFTRSVLNGSFVCLFVGDLGLACGPRYRFFGAAYDYGSV